MIYGVQFTLTYTAWDTVANAGKTGDVANHSLRWIKDGVDAAATNAPAEVSAANAPGEYKVVITAAEAQALIGKLAGKSATANISIIPQQVTFERLPNVDPGTNGGLPTTDANNKVNAKVATGDIVDISAARAAKIDNLDAAVTTRSSHTAADVWAVGARTLTAFGFAVDISAAAVSAIWDKLTAGIVTANSIGKRIIDNLNATVSSRAATGDAMTLTAGERTAIANEVEAQIIDETDSEKVLTAITDKIASVNPSLGALTLAAIAAAVRDQAYAGAAAGSIGKALSDLAARLPGGGTIAVQTDIPSAAAIGAQITADHGAGSYIRNTEPLDAAGVRGAVGLGFANLDAQLDALPTAVENADTLLDRDMSSGADTGTETKRTVRQALRPNRNKVDIPAGVVMKEDDATASHHFAVTTDPAADPITGINPTGGA